MIDDSLGFQSGIACKSDKEGGAPCVGGDVRRTSGGYMARTFAKAFYKSKAWLNCREAYIKSQRGLCEECLKEGRLTPAEIVHHKVELTPENINDPNISLNFDNLEAVCHACHDKIHDRRKRRYHVDELGNVIPY